MGLSQRELRLVVLGAGGVGKSSLTAQFVQGLWLDGYDATIEDSHLKQVEIDNKHYVLEILDTAGTEQFTALRELYIRSGQGFLLVFSLTSSSTLEEISILRDQIINIKNGTDVPIVICANKADLESDRAVSRSRIAQLSEHFGADVPVYETSAKKRYNVEDVFMTLVRLVIRKDGAAAAVQTAPPKRAAMTAISPSPNPENEKCCDKYCCGRGKFNCLKLRGSKCIIL